MECPGGKEEIDFGKLPPFFKNIHYYSEKLFEDGRSYVGFGKKECLTAKAR